MFTAGLTLRERRRKNNGHDIRVATESGLVTANADARTPSLTQAVSFLSKKILLTASKTEFVFSDGQRESRFRPVVYLSPDKKISGVGTPPTAGVDCLMIDIFNQPAPAADALSILESMMRFGVRSVSPGFISRPPTVRIAIGDDIRAELKGFAPALFRTAATQAGAVKVEIQEEPG